MGVPKFYRWLSERYPCLSEVVKEHQIPEFDNLYLDMNGIIHICSHPNDDDPHFRISEEKIFESIFHYIEVLFRMIQPKKLFFMAVDGVAPRAKMNQQRSRRFKSAKEAELNEKKARDRGEELPKEARFDSNCITPGTPFMVRLHSQLMYFVTSKISTDPLWQQVRVILSGHETPGEGEHKIMEFIRYEKSKPGYDPNIRHCLYGLDADLIMLGMCTHDPHFSLLREEVRFGGKKSNRRIPTPEETTFHLLHLSLLREYLEHEFAELRSASPPFKFDLEKIIDDWIMLGFLVGNDFIPHLPHLHINKGALSELYSTYKAVIPTLGGYINEGGHLNLKRFEVFLQLLSEKEMERFDNIYSDTKWLEGKTAKKGSSKKHFIKSTPGPAHVHEILEGIEEDSEKAQPSAGKPDRELQQLIQSAEEFMSGGEEDDDEDDASTMDEGNDDVTVEEAGRSSARGNSYHMEFRQHKREYYIRKLGYTQVDSDVLREQAECYVRAIQWNLHYYYHGVASWSWFYPHHFAPWITDVRNFGEMNMSFKAGTPFLPFQQLLAVLPAASKELLPQSLQGLMVNETSPIIDYFPPEFETDLNGKQQDWEAVVLIPFIDERRLLKAMEEPLKHMTKEEEERNKHGPMQDYEFTLENLGRYPAPAFFPEITVNHALLRQVYREDWQVRVSDLRLGLLPGVRLDVFFPGFPTLAHIPHKAKLVAAGVKVFEQASRGENLILKLEPGQDPKTREVAEELLQREIWVSWPHMVEAKVFEVVDSSKVYWRADKKLREEWLTEGAKTQFVANVKSIAERYKSRWGIDIGQTKIILQASLMTGRKYVCGNKGRITLEKQWSRNLQPFCLQATKRDILVHDPSFTQYRTLDELFAPESRCFMLGKPYYGCLGKVTQVDPAHHGRVRLLFSDPEEPDLAPVMRARQDLSVSFFPAYRAAQELGISGHVISRITGSILINKSPKEADPDRQSRVNVGLNLKFNKRNEEVCGYTQRRVSDGMWLYSERTIALVDEYIRQFPELFHYLARSNSHASKDVFHVDDVFGIDEFGGVDEAGEKKGHTALTNLSKWLKDVPSASAQRQACGTEVLDEEVMHALEKCIDGFSKSRRKDITMQVRPHLLYKADLWQGHTMPDESARFFLFDRVVNVREGHSVPLGLRGTITGILGNQTDGQEGKTVEVLFDEAFTGGMAIRSSPGRSYRMPISALINLSYGRGVEKGSNYKNGVSGAEHKEKKPTAVVHPRSVAGNGKAGQHQQPKQILQRDRKEPPAAVVPANKVQPPDPKKLPNPTHLFAKREPQRHKLSHSQEDQQSARARQYQQQRPKRQQQQQKPRQAADFANLWDELHSTPDQLSGNLKELLKIGDESQATDTVTQFFATAAAANARELLCDPAKPQPQTQQQLQPRPTALSRQKRDSRQHLEDLIARKTGGNAKYKVTNNSHGFVCASVTMPWGRTFTGEWTADGDEEAAAENAAQAAVDFFSANGFPQVTKVSTQQVAAKKPQFVPMQVSKRQLAGTKPGLGDPRVQDRHKNAAVGAELSDAHNDGVSEWVSQEATLDQTQKTKSPRKKKSHGGELQHEQSHQKKGGDGGSRKRKPRLAANFGGNS